MIILVPVSGRGRGPLMRSRKPKRASFPYASITWIRFNGSSASADLSAVPTAPRQQGKHRPPAETGQGEQAYGGNFFVAANRPKKPWGPGGQKRCPGTDDLGLRLRRAQRGGQRSTTFGFVLEPGGVVEQLLFEFGQAGLELGA